MEIKEYALNSELDSTTLKIMKFIHESNILNNTNYEENLLKYNYLEVCNYNSEGNSDVWDYSELLQLVFAGYNSDMNVDWSIDYNCDYNSEIKRKCFWCKSKILICPMRIYVDLREYAIQNEINVGELLDEMLGVCKVNYKINEVKEKLCANKIKLICDEYAKLKVAKLLIDNDLVRLYDEKLNNTKINFQYVNLCVNKGFLFDNLYNYYTNQGDIINGFIEAKKASNLFNVFELAAYILFLCRKENISTERVFDIIFSSKNNYFVENYNTYYNFICKNIIDNLDCEIEVKNQLKEVITYIRNYYTQSKHNLPYVQLNINLQTENLELENKIIDLIYNFALTSKYITENKVILDMEFLYKKFERDSEVLSQIDNFYSQNGLIVIRNLEKLLSDINRMENVIYAINSSIQEYLKKITIIISKNDITQYIKGYPILNSRIQHNIKIKDYSLRQVQDIIIGKIIENNDISIESQNKIKEIIEKEYNNSELINSDYIEKIYNKILYNNFNKNNYSNVINVDSVEENSGENVCKDIKDLIGLDGVKREVNKFKNFLLFNKKLHNKIEIKNMNMNMLFLGNPGTGKTTVARIMTNILFELGYIKKNKFVEVVAKDLVSGYIGQTALKTAQVIENALDGVLFIDEAYSIVSENKQASYGEESIAILVQAMEKYKERLVVIYAGYILEMKKFLNANPGIDSRIGYTFEFSDYTVEELIQIIEKSAENKGFSITEEAKALIKEIVIENKNSRNFGNARFMINLFEKLLMVHAQDFTEDELMIINKKDVLTLINENHLLKKDVISVQKELHKLVGLDNVKKNIQGLIDLVEFNNKLEKKIPLNLNMIFIGNTGTGKTTVARLFADILYNLGYIKNNKLIEVTGKDLIGEYIGQSAGKTANVLENALDGLLFIDDAYTIMNQTGAGANYSQDVISTITSYMDNYQGRLKIIFAGDKDEMKEFLEINSNLVAKIGEIIEFKDYTNEELLQIFMKEVQKIEFEVIDDAKEEILRVIEINRNTKKFGNAKFVLNLLKKTLMTHARRFKNIECDNELKIITKEDIPEIKPIKENKIGF